MQHPGEGTRSGPQRSTLLNYLFTVLTILNVAALVAVGWFLMGATAALAMTVEAAISEEVRKQDDRIEKRLQRAQGPAEDAPQTQADGVQAKVLAGRPTRRR